jgi:hypothetical protein
VGIGIASLYPGAKLDVNGNAVTRGVHYLAYSDNRIEAIWDYDWPAPHGPSELVIFRVNTGVSTLV